MTTENLSLILASGSPRRREFFTRMGWTFTVVKPGTEERVHPGETPEQYVRRNAEEKAADAHRMLRELSGRTHQVMTGLCIRTAGAMHSRTVVTDVEFKPLTDAEIDAYIRTGEPMDKAGAYAIQGLAAYMIRSVRGSYTNVVGLPLAETVEALAPFGFVPNPAAQ